MSWRRACKALLAAGGRMSFAVPAEFDSRVRRAEPLSRHTSWHVGGPADIFFMPRDRA